MNPSSCLTNHGRIVHPSDGTESSLPAFQHAIRLSLSARSRLDILNVVPREGEPVRARFPAVRDVLENWKLLPEDSPRSEVAKLGVKIRKIQMRNSDPSKAILYYLREHSADLTILGTRQRTGLQRFRQQRVSEPISQGTTGPALFVPHSGRRFVEADGRVNLSQVVIAVDNEPDPAPCAGVVAELINLLKVEKVRVLLVHVGPKGSAPLLDHHRIPGAEIDYMTLDGDPVSEILKVCDATGAQLLGLTTAGPDGFLESIFGSTTENLIRRSPCPVLTVPAPGRFVA